MRILKEDSCQKEKIKKKIVYIPNFLIPNGHDPSSKYLLV